MILAIFLRKYISYSSRSGHDSYHGISDMSSTNSESSDVDADGDQPLSTHFRIHGNDLLLLVAFIHSSVNFFLYLFIFYARRLIML